MNSGSGREMELWLGGSELGVTSLLKSFMDVVYQIAIFLLLNRQEVKKTIHQENKKITKRDVNN